MSKPTLTDPVVKALVASDKPFIRFCGQLPGFGVVVRPTGSKSFIVQYDFGGRKGETRKVTIGRFPTVKATDARKEAQKILSQVKLGTDVAAAKSKKRAELTVAELCDEYMKDGCVGKKASTIATDKGRIERHIKPLLGKKRIGDVEKSDVQRFLNDIARGKTAVDEKTKKHGRARVTGGEGAATRTVRLLGGIFTYAVDRKYIATNPRHGVKLFKDGKGERFLSPEELARLSDALHEAETVGLPWQLSDGPNSKHRPHKGGDQREVVSPYAVAAIRLLLFTGCRAGEVLNLMWADVDGLNGLLHIRDSKTGAKKVPLTAPAMAVLSELPRSGNYVIAGSAPDKPRSDLKRPWKRITDHANLPGLRIHDLRHSFASAGAASGMGLAMVGKLLGHASPATTARYAHFADNAAQAAANSIANSIAAHMRGSAAADNVVALRVKDGSNG